MAQFLYCSAASPASHSCRFQCRRVFSFQLGNGPWVWHSALSAAAVSFPMLIVLIFPAAVFHSLFFWNWHRRLGITRHQLTDTCPALTKPETITAIWDIVNILSLCLWFLPSVSILFNQFMSCYSRVILLACPLLSPWCSFIHSLFLYFWNFFAVSDLALGARKNLNHQELDGLIGQNRPKKKYGNRALRKEPEPGVENVYLVYLGRRGNAS